MNEKHKEWSDGLYVGGPGQILTRKQALGLATKRWKL